VNIARRSAIASGDRSVRGASSSVIATSKVAKRAHWTYEGPMPFFVQLQRSEALIDSEPEYGSDALPAVVDLQRQVKDRL